MKLKYIIELLVNKYNIEFDVVDDNEIVLYDINLYDVDDIELLQHIKYNIVRYDEINNELFIKIDDDEFEFKNEINNYDELIKYNFEIKNYVELLENDNEYIEIYNNSIGMNKLNDYIHNFHLNHNNFYSFKLSLNDDDVELLYKFKKIVNEFYVDDVELFVDIDELFDDYENYLINFNDYLINIYNENYIVVDNNKKIIKNIDDVYNFIGSIIIKYLTFDNNDKLIDYDNLIKLLNIIQYDYHIINHNNILFKIDIDIDIDDDIDEIVDKFIECYDNYKLNEFDNYYEFIEIDDVFELFNVDDVIEFIENNVDVNYDEIDYDNFIKLNNLFYSIENNKTNKGMI